MSVRRQDDAAGDEGRLKLKPLHWDKVRASSDRNMVWDRLKSNSFQLRLTVITESREIVDSLLLLEAIWCINIEMIWVQCRLDEDMIEVLFTNNSANAPSTRDTLRKAGVSQCRQEKVLDPKKAQNIAILLRALNFTLEEVSDALLDGKKIILSYISYYLGYGYI
jgi:hypothetical protein